MVYVEVIFTAFYFLLFIAWYFNTGKGLRKKMTVINGMLSQETLQNRFLAFVTFFSQVRKIFLRSVVVSQKAPIIQFISNHAYCQYFFQALTLALTFTMKLLVLVIFNATYSIWNFQLKLSSSSIPRYLILLHCLCLCLCFCLPRLALLFAGGVIFVYLM